MDAPGTLPWAQSFYPSTHSRYVAHAIFARGASNGHLLTSYPSVALIRAHRKWVSSAARTSNIYLPMRLIWLWIVMKTLAPSWRTHSITMRVGLGGEHVYPLQIVHSSPPSPRGGPRHVKGAFALEPRPPCAGILSSPPWERLYEM